MYADHVALTWQMRADPVPPPMIPVMAERGGTQLKTPRPVLVEVAECLKAVERLGIKETVKVYVGSQDPLLHDFKSYL
jgi:hypothetical protein